MLADSIRSGQFGFHIVGVDNVGMLRSVEGQCDTVVVVSAPVREYGLYVPSECVVRIAGFRIRFSPLNTSKAKRYTPAAPSTYNQSAGEGGAK